MCYTDSHGSNEMCESDSLYTPLKNLNRYDTRYDDPSVSFQGCTNTDFVSYPTPTQPLADRSVVPRFRTSPFIVSRDGLIINKDSNSVIEGFTAGPNYSVIGPDGRIVLNARIGIDGRRVEILDYGLEKVQSIESIRQKISAEQMEKYDCENFHFYVCVMFTIPCYLIYTRKYSTITFTGSSLCGCSTFFLKKHNVFKHNDIVLYCSKLSSKLRN